MFKPGEVTWSQALSRTELEENRRAPFVRNVGTNLAQAGAILALLPPPPATVLDCGCADGHLTALMALQGYDAVGIDACPHEINWASEQEVNWRGNSKRGYTASPR